jgi:uncharacterized metal-binding protein YceD (DUF177 family)
MTVIETAQLEVNQPLHLNEELPAQVLELNEPGAQEYHPLAADVTVLKNEDGELTITGTVKTTLKLQCSRCAEVIDWPINAQVEHILESPLPNFVDVAELLREDVLLEMPLTPACRLSAENRCPITGQIHKQRPEQNLSLTSESLWDALSKIKPDK